MDGSLFVGMTGSGKEWQGHKKIMVLKRRASIIFKQKTGFWKKKTCPLWNSKPL